MLKQVAGALDYAHSLGVIHRDLKPSNIIWSEHQQAKITDFGIAKLVAENEVRLTRPGSFVGTPRYASPEQVRGEDTGPGSDIFSFGILAFELLTSISPFPGSSISEILFKIAACDANYAPIENQLNMTAEPIRRTFQRVFQYEPRNRYRRAGDFFEALSHNLNIAKPLTNHLPPNPNLRATQTTRLAGPLKQDEETLPSPFKAPLQDSYSSSQGKSTSTVSPHRSVETQPPQTPSSTMQMPRHFHDNQAAAQNLAQNRRSVRFRGPSFASNATRISKPSPKPAETFVQKQTQARKMPANYRYEEPKEKPWWILMVLGLVMVFGLFGWLLWPEIQTFFPEKPTPTASNMIANNTNEANSSASKDASDLSVEMPQDSFSSQQPTPNIGAEIQGSKNTELPTKTAGSERDSQPTREKTSPQKPQAVQRPAGEESKPQRSRSEPIPARKLNPVRQDRIKKPRITRFIQPTYPSQALAEGLEGSVTLEAEISADGQLGNIRVLKTLGERRFGFEDAAVKALLDCEFEPGTLNGTPKAMRESFSFEFALPNYDQLSEQPFAQLMDEPSNQQAITPQAPEEKEQVLRPAVYKKVKPVYPIAGKQAGIEGDVVLKARLTKNAELENIEVLQGLGDGTLGFEQAAIEAFKQYRFYPGKKNGNTVDMDIKATISFKLPP